MTQGRQNDLNGTVAAVITHNSFSTDYYFFCFLKIAN